MSVTIETVVACDGCGDNWNADDRSSSASQIRVSRKLHGWTQVGRQDYCEYCTAERKLARRENRPPVFGNHEEIVFSKAR